MADNVAPFAGAGSVVTEAFDDVAGVYYRLIKLAFGALDTATIVSTANGLPVNIVAGGAGDGAILDGVTASIKATVLDYASSNPLAVRLTDTAGDYIAAGAGTQYTEDAAAAADPVGTALIMVRDDALSAQTTTDGDNVAARGTDKGELYVKHADTITVGGSGATNLGKVEDSGHATGDVGVMALAVRNDTPNAELAVSDLSYIPIAAYRTGALRIAPPGEDFAALGSNSVKKYFTATGATTDGIVWSPAAGKRWYITDILFTTSAAATITFEDDVAAGDVAVMGGDFAANSGFAHHFSTPLFSQEDAADFMVTTSAGNIKVTITGYEI